MVVYVSPDPGGQTMGVLLLGRGLRKLAARPQALALQ